MNQDETSTTNNEDDYSTRLYKEGKIAFLVYCRVFNPKNQTLETYQAPCEYPYSVIFERRDEFIYGTAFGNTLFADAVRRYINNPLFASIVEREATIEDFRLVGVNPVRVGWSFGFAEIQYLPHRKHLADLDTVLLFHSEHAPKYVLD
jgi:hypothetical protein